MTAPERIWLLDYGSGECVWCDCPDPDSEDHEPVKYVRADLIERLTRPQPSTSSVEAVARAIPMLLYCPQCGQQHIDAPDERTPDWSNPPHRSHLCHDCGCIWRPADVPTEGVATISTVGKADTWTAERGNAEAVLPSPEREPLREALEGCFLVACDYTLSERDARNKLAEICRAALAPPPVQSGDRT